MILFHRTLKLLAVLLLPSCATWNVVNILNNHEVSHTQADADAEWPARWQGRPLRPLALSDVERRFSVNFPGKIAHLTNDRDVLVWRHVSRPTRMLHPAADCYRASGWRIHDERLEQVENGGSSKRWRCFTAERSQNTTRLKVCERIEDATGQGFTDTSNWYWATMTGQSVGPWQAVTVASPALIE